MAHDTDSKGYWDERLKRNFNSRGVGHMGFGEGYNRWVLRRKLRCLREVLRGLKLKDKRVLDVGCGTGLFIKWYLAKGCKVTGMDIAETSVTRLRAIFPCEFYAGDIAATDYPHPQERFDLVNMWDVIFHIVDDKAYNRALDNIANHLKEGGLLLLTDYLGAAADMLLAPHLYGRCLQTYEINLRRRGLHLIQLRPLYRFLMKSHLGPLDDHLGSLYYFADNRLRNIPADNISLTIWRCCGVQ